MIFYSAHLLALLMFFVGWVDSYSWDIVVSEEKRLQFYNNGTLTHTEDIPSAKGIYAITYDPVHYRVLFADYNSPYMSISSFDLSTRNIQPLVTIVSNVYLEFDSDPVTQLLFWQESSSIYSCSLNSTSFSKAVDKNLVVTPYNDCWDIAVDSCGGYLNSSVPRKYYNCASPIATCEYIYWITKKEIERARFDGSEREVLLNSTVTFRLHLAIDQQTQKIYWIDQYHKSGEFQTSIESADFNGKNRRTLYTFKKNIEASSLTISNDFIYWHGSNQNAIWQLPKNHSQQLEPKMIAVTTNSFYWLFKVIAANYTIKDQLKGNQNCETLKSLIPNESKYCVHGTKISGESRCECTQGYIGERCDISVCQNYCFQGNCRVSAAGQPKCSCKTGYSGQRCEVNECRGYCLNSGVCFLNEEGSPICQCTIDYKGERCGVSICKDYCFQGHCNINAEGQPICSCADGYSGERCEFNVSCINHDNMVQQIIRNLRSEVKQVIKEELQVILHSEVKQVIKEELQSTMLSEVNQVQVIKEDLQRTLQFISDKNDENEAKIQKCEKLIKDLENNIVGLQKH